MRFLKKGSKDFFEILDLSTPNTREKYLLKAKYLDFFSLQATAVDRCVTAIKMILASLSWNRVKKFRLLLGQITVMGFVHMMGPGKVNPREEQKKL